MEQGASVGKRVDSLPIEKEAVSFFEELQSCYFKQRDFDRILAMLDENVTWIGPGGILTGRRQAAQFFSREKKRAAHSFQIISAVYQARALAAGFCLVYGTLKLQEAGSPETAEYCVSAGCRLIDGGFRLLNLHVSQMGTEPAERGFSQKQAFQYPSLRFQKLDTKIIPALDDHALSGNIPGGVQIRLHDPDLTILHVSGAFLEMTGYTAADLKSRFQNRMLSIVHPDDRGNLLSKIRRDLAKGRSTEAEYRVTCKDGNVLWVLEKGQLVRADDGEEYLSCILVDITSAREAQEKLRLNLERFQIILDQANDIILEWDIQADTLFFSANWEKAFGCPPIADHVSVTHPLHSRLHSDDLEILDKIIESIKKGVPYAETEVRIRKADGNYVWRRLRITTQYHADGVPCKAVGIMIDIDAEKRRSRMLLEKAERDALTNLYNKGASQTLIQNYLLEHPDETCALLIIDIDNFKQMNDSFGHLFGDALLIEMSGEIQKLFRSADVVGRVGGDEFIALIKGIPDSEVAAKKAEQIVQAFQNIVIREKRDCQITCTIGISLSPLHGGTFPELYQKADQALYFAKNQGKNQFIVFDETVMEECFPDPPAFLPPSANGSIPTSGRKR